MRTLLQLAAYAALIAMWCVTAYFVAGPHPLPGRIPTHFDLAGKPNAWGTPGMLWLLPIVATVIIGLMTLVARHPGAFNYPVRVSPLTRPRLERITLGMIGWLQLEIAGMFLWIQYATIESAHAARNGLSPVFVPIALVVVIGTAAVHIRAMFAAARSKAS